MDDNTFEENTGIEENLDNNGEQQKPELTKKEKAEEASHDVAEVAARVVGRYVGGPVGGTIVDTALNTKLGQTALRTASKRVASTPIAKGSLAMNHNRIQKAAPIANQVIDKIGGTSVDSSSGSSSGVDKLKSKSNYDNKSSTDGKNTGGSGLLKIRNGLNFKTKLIIICVIACFVFLFFFIIILITPLMELGIIDISGGGSSSGGSGTSSNTYYKNVSNSCSSVIVGNTAVELEDYVAGVVSAEAYTSEGMEALKAQAIAARTYAITRTNQCKNAIRNSSADQNYTSNINDRARQATEETKGLVLTYNSELFSTEYDSYYKGGDYSCNDNGCSVTYSKLPNYEKHVVNISASRKGYAAGGHGRGMSQLVSYDLAEQGYTFDYILSYFYSPGVQINSLYGTSGYTGGMSGEANNFVSRTEIPSNTNQNDIKYYYSNENISYAGGYVGECTWYAFGRANEILDQANSDLEWIYAPHAKNWLDYNLQSQENAFSYSTDVTEPKVGAIIVWSSNEFGHVAIVEKVNSDGTIDYSEANIHSVKSDSNPYGFRYQSNISYTETGVGSISKIWEGYEFVGYIYMVE